MVEALAQTLFQPQLPTAFNPNDLRTENRGPREEEPRRTSPAETKANEDANSNTAAVLELTTEEEREVARLQTRDQKVRQHERAHLSAAGSLAVSGAKLQFTVGPDGRRYAASGEVSISVSKEFTPEATIRKAQTIRRAALAPADPSGQDRAIAAQANHLEANAQQELREGRAEEIRKTREPEPERQTRPPGVVEEENKIPENTLPELRPIGDILDLVA